MSNPSYQVRPGTRLMRHPGTLVLSYRDERIPVGEPLIVTYVSHSGNTVSLWLEQSQRPETVHLRELAPPDFTVIGTEVENPTYFNMLALTYAHGRQIRVGVGTKLIRTGRPFSTGDDQVPYDCVLTITRVSYRDHKNAAPSDYVEFECAEGTGSIGVSKLRTAYFELIEPWGSP